MLLFGMMMFGNVLNAQNDDLKARIERNKFKHELKESEKGLEGYDERERCVDDENSLAATGHGKSLEQSDAQWDALEDAKRVLQTRLEQAVEAMITDFASKTTYEQSSKDDATLDKSRIRKVNAGFRNIIKSSMSEFSECRVLWKQNDRGEYEYEYNGKIDRNKIKQDMQDFMKKEGAIRSQSDLDNFEETFDKALAN